MFIVFINSMNNNLLIKCFYQLVNAKSSQLSEKHFPHEHLIVLVYGFMVVLRVVMVFSKCSSSVLSIMKNTYNDNIYVDPFVLKVVCLSFVK